MKARSRVACQGPPGFRGGRRSPLGSGTSFSRIQRRGVAAAGVTSQSLGSRPLSFPFGPQTVVILIRINSCDSWSRPQTRGRLRTRQRVAHRVAHSTHHLGCFGPKSRSGRCRRRWHKRLRRGFNSRRHIRRANPLGNRLVSRPAIGSRRLTGLATRNRGDTAAR